MAIATVHVLCCTGGMWYVKRSLSKKDKKLVFKTNYRLMQVNVLQIGSILQNF